ncbi:MAG: glutamate racemase [Lewinellaceae bacterium]|nr:glutamate racemase [Saprospiraceae bacterium]MCB9333218.1 glutamate racemase [Lewinellaceae bacterium]
MEINETTPGPIGIFDSGYGGLSVFKEIAALLPQYDYIYFGDNARAPYGIRSFDTIYKYTLECVRHLFDQGCHLVILACNTASAKALRTIQQHDLPTYPSSFNVLGVIRPTTELIGHLTATGHVGIMATTGTVQSQSYVVEIEKFFPEVHVYQQACPMWVPLIENNEHTGPGADYFVKKYIDALLAQSEKIDTIVLGCTHYPLLLEKIRAIVPATIKLVSQGEIVADRLADYLLRHPEIETMCRKTGQYSFFTTETPEVFDEKAQLFYGKAVCSAHFEL